MGQTSSDGKHRIEILSIFEAMVSNLEQRQLSQFESTSYFLLYIGSLQEKTYLDKLFHYFDSFVQFWLCNNFSYHLQFDAKFKSFQKFSTKKIYEKFWIMHPTRQLGALSKREKYVPISSLHHRVLQIFSNLGNHTMTYLLYRISDQYILSFRFDEKL